LTMIEIRRADWNRDRDVLAEIRRRVFIEEQGVPPELEWDGKDEDAAHWLAQLNGQPIGTARMLRDGHVGRMAVLARGRHQGAGTALLKTIIADAHEQQLRELFLHAQTHALTFYQRFGFVAEGPEFLDAAMPHRTMRLILRADRTLGRDSARLNVVDRRALAIDLARQTKRTLRVLSNTLDPDTFDNLEFTHALSQLARYSRYSDIRLLVVEARPIAQRGHRVLELARKLSTAIQLRRVDCEPATITENFIVADETGVLCYALREPEKAWADYHNRPLAENYALQFDELWHRSIDDPELRLLNL